MSDQNNNWEDIFSAGSGENIDDLLGQSREDVCEAAQEESLYGGEPVISGFSAEELEEPEQEVPVYAEELPVQEQLDPVPQGEEQLYWDDEQEIELVPPRPLRRGEALVTGKQLEEDEFDSDDIERRDYYPIRFRRDSKTGCLGGFMYAVFVISVSIILACMAWMAASDVLALNKEEITATIELPKEIFQPVEVDVEDEEGNVIGTETVQSADIDYIADQLKDNGIIEYKFLFKLFAKISDADQKVDPGTYTLSTSFDYRALVKKMQIGSESQVRTKVTFPEGFTMHQIFTRLEANDICSYEDLEEAAATYDYSYEFLEEIPLGEASRLEGYLFPDTYEFYEGMSATSAINKLLATFHYKLTAEQLERAEELGMSLREVLTIASMIEKEAAVVGEENDRAEISSVIHNRLAAGMTLGVDATILYVYPDHQGAPTAQMLQQDDPYNTRTRTGLPPTPICSPSEASIIAALYPASTGYYFYALDTATGMHRFFTNDRDFNYFVSTQNYG